MIYLYLHLNKKKQQKSFKYIFFNWGLYSDELLLHFISSNFIFLAFTNRPMLNSYHHNNDQNEIHAHFFDEKDLLDSF